MRYAAIFIMLYRTISICFKASMKTKYRYHKLLRVFIEGLMNTLP